MKVLGFIGSLAAGAAMVGAAVTGTGAYFTDSKDGNLSASSGHLRLSADNTNLTFDSLMPGEDKTKNIEYDVAVTGKSDVWLMFDKNNLGYLKWTGDKNNQAWTDGGMGRYGHVKIANSDGTLFESWNLQNLPPNGTDPVCAVDANGHGTGRPATSVADTPPLCGVPTAIKVADNLSDGAHGLLSITFGITGRWAGGTGNVLMDFPVAGVPFKVVATQHGIRPDAANF